MVIKEYKEIRSGKKILVSKTSDHHLLSNFVQEMSKKGNTTFSFFVNKEKADNFTPNKENEYPGSIDWSDDFNHNDMLNMLVSYLSHFSPRDKINFVSQLNTIIMGELITTDLPPDDEEGAYHE